MWSLARTNTKRIAPDKLEMRSHASTQLRAVKASDTNLTTKTGNRKAGRTVSASLSYPVRNERSMSAATQIHR